MNEISLPFTLNDRQREEIPHKYGLLESLLGGYLSPKEKRKYAEAVRQEVQISERMLRRYSQRFREQGICAFTRKRRSDAERMWVFSEQILRRAQELVKQKTPQEH